MKFPQNRILQLIGAVLCVIGVVGLFSPISKNDGALAITGAILLTAGLMSQRGGLWK